MDTGLMQAFKQQSLPVVDSATMKLADAGTMLNEPIASRDLMERASRALFNRLNCMITDADILHFIIGPGNNGGDGLCMAGMALAAGKKVKVSTAFFDKQPSEDNYLYHRILQLSAPGLIKNIVSIESFKPNRDETLIDCIFGTGLTNGVSGEFLKLLQNINTSGNKIISVDIPSGLFSESLQKGEVFVQAVKTITIQAPKPSFFYAENRIDFSVVNAGIKIQSIGNCYFLSPEEPHKTNLLHALPERDLFGYKGTFGHVLLVGGNKGMHGAIAIAANACCRAGAGLTTVLAPAAAKLYLSPIPKVMHIAKPIAALTLNNIDLSKFSVLAVGPGLGRTPESTSFLSELLDGWNKPVILDADALNILSENPELWKLVPPGSILTPHPGEFQRLFGVTESSADKFSLAKKQAQEIGIYIVSKNKYSALFCPNGDIFFNGSGNASMAQGGSGDRLTGMIAGLVARTGDSGFGAAYGMYAAGFND